MELTRLSGTNLEVSRLSFGGCPMGGHGWGPVSQADFVRAVNAALDKGVNFFDTADTYGLGDGERTLGVALGRNREKAVIATKFGVRVEGGRTVYDNSPAWIRQALEDSLNRLSTDYVDLYQMHYRDGKTPLEDVVGTLVQLRGEGKIRHFGLSNIGNADVAELQQHPGVFTTFQNEFSLANRSHESGIRVLTAEFGLTPLTWGSLGQGVLSGKYDETTRFAADDRRSRPIYRNFHGPKLQHNLRIVSVLQAIGHSLDKSVPAVAIRWILDRLPGSVAVVGIKNVSQLESNVEALNWSLPQHALDALHVVSADESEAV